MTGRARGVVSQAMALLLAPAARHPCLGQAHGRANLSSRMVLHRTACPGQQL